MLLHQPSPPDQGAPSRSGPASSRSGSGGGLAVLTAAVFLIATAVVVVLWSLAAPDCSRGELAVFGEACAADGAGTRPGG